MHGKQLRLLFLIGFVFANLAAASPIQVTLTGVNGAAAFGVYIGPYYGAFGSSAVTLFCDDWANDAFLGQTWLANLSAISDGSDLGMTRFGGQPNALQLYQEVAWLDTQFASQKVSQWADIHATIWQIFDPAGAPAPSSNHWLTEAQDDYKEIAYDNFRVVTNVAPVAATGQIQEFLTVGQTEPQNTTSAVPEPAALLLAGGGLIGGALLLRRRLSRIGHRL